MENTAHRAIAIVGVGAILPDAPNLATFWQNVKSGRYSISEVDSQRWNPAFYYDPDPRAPDKTYSKIGGWVREFAWEPMKWHLPIPPRVAEAMDTSQKWGIACTRQALEDYGYPQRTLEPDRTAVILGNAMGGERHYFTVMRVYFPEYAQELTGSESFAALPELVRKEIVRELRERMGKHLPEITEDSMPGELANCIAGRIANIFNFHGPNFVCDAACASAMAAIGAAAEGLAEHKFDYAISGGIDRNMGVSTFVKFCKIGALSATGTRPYAEGADGFVMGEGAAIFLLKRLADAERDGDKIYAVLRGMGGSSDGKGKGITAPNPLGQKFAIERAWENAGLSPATVTYIEGHGTSTRVGDVVEVQSMAEVLSSFNLPVHSVALGSVKSNFGHLKGAAGAAGMLKTILALHDKVLPPSTHCEHPNPDIDFAHSPLFVNTDLRPWAIASDGVRRAGLSAFGFGGTNFHAVLEEYIPHRLNGNGKQKVTVSDMPAKVDEVVATFKMSSDSSGNGSGCKAPLRGALLIGATSTAELVERLRTVEQKAKNGNIPIPAAPAEVDLRAPERLAIDYADADELDKRCGAALKAFAANQPGVWKALRAQGVFLGHGPAPKVAFLYPGQGSQYLNMLRPLRGMEPIVAETFVEADRVMSPLLGKPLSDFIFVDSQDPAVVAKAEDDLRQTAITQPAVLTADLALTRLLAAYGIVPDFTMGHSLGEYGALIAADGFPFEDALEAVSARGREMTRFSPQDKGKMAAVFAPLEEIERVLKTISGYVVIANINSEHQSVIGGDSKAVEQAISALQKAGYDVTALPVSHAFHTSIVAPASEPLRNVLERLRLQSPRLPIVANVDGEFYPTGPDVVPKMLDILARQVAAPVQFIKGLRTLYAAGARIFVEVGPKKALQGFAEDVLGSKGDVVSIFSNHPKVGDIVAFNQALCCLYAAGLGRGVGASAAASVDASAIEIQPEKGNIERQGIAPTATKLPEPAAVRANGNRYAELGRLFANVLDQGWHIYHDGEPGPTDRPVTISGAALGLPGTERIFDDGNIGRILRGDQFIAAVPKEFRQAMLDKHITRLVKSEKGEPTFEPLHDIGEVIKLAGRGGAFDLEAEFGVSSERCAALDRVTRLAIAVGLDAMRDAGIPLVLRYKKTSKGTQLPDRWALPDALRDETGVIFASAFPGLNSFAEEVSRFEADRARREQLAALETLSALARKDTRDSSMQQELTRRVAETTATLDKDPYLFDRRYLFRVLAMGHSQFAEYIGARGPNTAINAACASTTQAVALAEDWIRAGRCRRVVVISADDVTSDQLIDWMGAGFLASGAAATDETVEDAAIPFDRRRHGMIIGMGAAGLVVESADSVRERGIQPICEVLSSATANSAFHGTRLDVQHIGRVMEDLVARAERHSGIDRYNIAPKTVFVSHETYTPARGGSAAAEIFALRQVFGDSADQIVIANTKGFTGHAMGAGIEDVVAVKALETGVLPPVANFKEVDPELGKLNLSKGGAYPLKYALRLGAGFGSQISMTLLHWVETKDASRKAPNELGYKYRIVDADAWDGWLNRIAGHGGAELEVVHRTLRVRQAGALTASAKEVSQATAIGPDSRHEIPAAQPETRTPVPTAIAGTSEVHGNTKAEPASIAAVQPASTTRLDNADPDSVRERVLTVVAEKTGYPVDMLDLDLDLEADLGVDTVKQAEVFAAIRETYGIAREENRKLRDYPTLAHVIRFVLEKAARPAPASAEADTAKAKESSAEATEKIAERAVVTQDVKARLLALVVERTGYPQDMLDLDLDLEADLGIDTVLDLEADLGIDTVKQAEMFAAIRAAYKIPRDENLKLREFPTLAHVIKFAEDRSGLAKEVGPLPPTISESKLATESPSTAPLETSSSVGLKAPCETPLQAISAASIKNKVLDIVAEKTGYPKDMLDLDLDLEADLGIDTVKQAEMFAAIRAAYNIPRDENLKLREFPTLAHVIKFAEERALPGKSSATQAATKKEAEITAVPVEAEQPRKTRPPLASLDAANRVPRRVPVPILRPPLRICKRTGITLQRGSRVVIMPDEGGIAELLAELLRKRDVDVLRLTPTRDPAALIGQLKNWISAGPIQGVYWLPALDQEADFRRMDVNAWHDAVGLRLKSLYSTMRTLYEHIAKTGTFLVSATRLGGQHGYDTAGAVAPLGGAVTGFTKTYKRERVDALVKAVDFEAGRKAEDIVQLLTEETLRDPAVVEVGYKNELRWTVGLEDQPAADGQAGMALNEKTVFLITGAAGSIVSAITADLAAASGGIFYLLDLVPEPDANNPDIKQFASDKEGLKRELFARIQARGERATPALVERELASLERAQAALNAISAVCEAGGSAHYFAVNLTDAEAVANVVNDVRERHGRIDVLLHAAGLDRSRSLADKEPREFDMVFDVKTDGMFNLLHAIGDMPLGAVVGFSSIAGRFGNPGQTDYSSANDLLCKVISSFRTTRPQTRGIAIDWTAWGGIGMATRGSIPKVMELAGIDMLSPEAGVPLIRRELTAGGTRGEIVIAERLGVLLNELDETGGIDTNLQVAAGAEHSTRGPMIGKLVSMGIHRPLRIETTLDPKVQPFLHDHQIDGTPVLPGVMGIEAFAEAALELLPGWNVAAIEDVNFHAPFKFYRHEPRAVTIDARIRSRNDTLLAECQLIGHRQLPNQAEPQPTAHFSGRVRLSRQVTEMVAAPRLVESSGHVIEASDIYCLYFHGPAYQVIERAWWDGKQIIGLMAKTLPSNHHPSALSTLMAPRLIELCFQTAGIWEMGMRARMGLPQHIKRVSTSLATNGEQSATTLYAVVRPNPVDESFDAEVIDEKGNRYVQLTGYHTIALPSAESAQRLKALHALMTLEPAIA